jgi:pseudouridine-5'-phosphate glycosidase
VPPEHELPREIYEEALEGALADAERGGVRGRDLTPFLLERMRVRTESGSVFSNLALLRANARAAAQLAVALATPV